MAELAADILYGWTAFTDFIGLLGILGGYWLVSRSLRGVVVGFFAAKILQFLLTPVLLGFLA